uniref:MBD domain-containing protein n=1 Tax=Anopheles coluzzii TaxID=1518534 RepID=A0A6E8VPR2_ANOCL
MGIRKCIVPECPSSSARPEDRGVTYHKIPYLDEMKRLWIVACHLPDDYFATKASNVCSRHFRRADFQEFKGKKYVLKLGVVPTVFPWTVTKPPGEAGSSTKSPQKTATKGKDEAKGTKVEETEEGEVPHEVGDMDGDIVVKEDAKVTALLKSEQAPKGMATPDRSKPKAAAPSKRPSSSKKVTKTPAKQARTAEPVASSTPGRKQTPKKGAGGEAKPASTASTAKEEPVVPNEPETGGAPEKPIDFTPGSKIEAQDFSGTWHAAKVVEVDTEEREVLVQFDKTDKLKSTTQEEWIPMDSVRLRPISNAIYSVGEKVFARWSDSRKFKATIKSVLENQMYEVVFDDGFAKICKSTHISRIKRSEDAKGDGPEREVVGAGGATDVGATVKTEPVEHGEGSEAAVESLVSLNQLRIPQVVKLSELPEIPQNGEWCCHWMNDYPVGESSEVDLPGGRVYTVIVPDWRMPEGWVKHIFQRITTYGKMDILLISPSGKVLRSRQEVKAYLAEIGEEYDPNRYDFGLHVKRAKQLGFCHYTQEYRDSFLPKPATEPVLLNTEVNIGAVKVKIIDNLFQCPEEDCLKTFRKENHLQIHIKHYHKELAKGLGDIPNMQDLAALRTPIELLETPKPVSRKSQTAAAGATPKASTAQSTPVREEAREEEELLPAEMWVESTVVMSDGKVEEALKPPREIKQEGEKAPESDASLMAMDTEASLAEESSADGSSTVTASTPASSSKSKGSSKVPKIKLFSQKKAAGEGGKKVVRHGLVTKKKVSCGSKKSKRPKPSRRPAANRSAPALLRPNDTTLAGSFAYGSGGFQNETVGGIYDESINASVAGASGAGGGLVDENGEVIKIVRMRKEEIINCLCKVTEEDGLMVQCEMCLCWQHAFCQNIRHSSEVPDTYVCSICRYPYRGRASKRYAHDQDWLYEGKLPVAKYHVTNSRHAQRFDILKNSHTLTGNLLELKRFMHSLQMKINIAEKKDHPKMYLWSKKWEKSPPRGDGSSSSSVGGGADKPLQGDGATAQQQQQQLPQIPVPEAPIDPAECQTILLDHIQKLQNDAMGRLQAIEAQIIGLEAYDEKADLLESPTAKNYPKTKQTIHMLLNDLLKMKKIGEIHSDMHSLTM